MCRIRAGTWSSRVALGNTSEGLTGRRATRRSNQRAASDSCSSRMRREIKSPKSVVIIYAPEHYILARPHAPTQVRERMRPGYGVEQLPLLGDVAFHRRQRAKQLILLMLADVELVERAAQVFDDGVEVGGGDAHAHVRGFHC